MLGTHTDHGSTFELSLLIRDSKGIPSGQVKSISTDSAPELSDFWLRFKGKPKKRRRRKAEKKEHIPSKQEATKIVSETEDYGKEDLDKRLERIEKE